MKDEESSIYLAFLLWSLGMIRSWTSSYLVTVPHPLHLISRKHCGYFPEDIWLKGHSAKPAPLVQGIALNRDG